MHPDLAEYGPVRFHSDPNALYERHLVFDYAIDPELATPRERYEAIARSLRDVMAMPKPGIFIEDIANSNNSQVALNAGHVHFYWIKGGWLFRAMAIGYASLNVFNAVVTKNQTVSWTGIVYAAILFGVGELLKYTWKPYLKLNRKYYLEVY